MIKINKVEDSIVEEKIANLLLSHRKDLTVEEADRISKWAMNNPIQVVFGTSSEILNSFQKAVNEKLN